MSIRNLNMYNKILNNFAPLNFLHLFYFEFCIINCFDCFCIGLLAVSAGKETILDAAGKTESSSGNADDIVMLEIDVKEPVKRSPLTASPEYGGSPNQYILPADASQGVLTNLFITQSFPVSTYYTFFSCNNSNL